MVVRKGWCLSLMAGLLCASIGAQAAKKSADEVAKELANPNTPLASLKFKIQYQAFTGDLAGADDQDSTVVLFQPSLPFPLDNGDKIIFRPALPLIQSQPVPVTAPANWDDESGIGDMGFDLVYATTSDSGLLLAWGAVGSLPTASEDSLGNDRISLGPELFVGKVSKTSIIGLFPNHQWDVGGSGDADVSLTSVQAFGVFLPGGGWNYGTSPTFTYDHVSDQWTAPLNLSFGRTLILGDRPWKFGLDFDYYVEQADSFGPDWKVTISITPVVENMLARIFSGSAD